MLVLLLISTFALSFNTQSVKASGIIYIRADGSIDPPTASVSTVDNITYIITDNINDLIVVQRDNIVVDGNGYTLQGTGSGTGVDLLGRINVTIQNTQIKNFYYGILLSSSINNSLSGNNITNNYYGICLLDSSNNTISRNNITMNNMYGVNLDFSFNNTASGNNIVYNYYGIGFYHFSNYNSIYGNDITTNNIGIWLSYSSDNKLHHNNIIDNLQQVFISPGYANVWDDGYPSGGNYWSDYTGVDEKQGPNQDEPGIDGIGDTQYILDADNWDNYPFVDPWSEHIIDVPWHVQLKGYYCGPASLEMVFDYYGEDIPQLEIAEVARTTSPGTYDFELRRSAHFSNISTSGGTEMPENITGYTLRQLGYAAFGKMGMTIDQLKTLIDNDFPIVLPMWSGPSHVYGHFRVAVGYNNTHIMLHDPLIPIYYGQFALNLSTFLDLWSLNRYYYGLFVSPWNVEINAPSNVEQGDTFNVTAKITYPCPPPFSTSNYSSSLCNATITLPTGLTLAQGETAKKPLGDLIAGSSTILSWTVEAENGGTYNLAVEAEGKVAGYVDSHGIFPSYSYEDRIGGKSSCILEVLVHDLSIENIVLSKTIVGQGYCTTMNVTIKNEGSFAENFTMEVYANTTSIASLKSTLSIGDFEAFLFTWNTSGFAKGNYTISAYAIPVDGETYIDDNNFTDGWLLITIAGDVTSITPGVPEGVVDMRDIGYLCGKFMTDDANCDINNDGTVNMRDIGIACDNFMKEDP